MFLENASADRNLDNVHKIISSQDTAVGSPAVPTNPSIFKSIQRAWYVIWREGDTMYPCRECPWHCSTCSLTTLSWSGCCSAVVVYSPCPRADSNLATQHWLLVSRVSAYLSICSLAITAPVSHPSHTTVCGAGCMCALCDVALVAAAESLVSASVWNEELTTPRTVASGTRTEGLQCHFQ